MVFHWDKIVASSRAIRDAGLNLKRNTERGDAGPVGEVNVHVFADILLLIDLLKPARVVLEKQPRGVHAIPAGDAAGTRFHDLILACFSAVSRHLALLFTQ